MLLNTSEPNGRVTLGEGSNGRASLLEAVSMACPPAFKNIQNMASACS